MCVCVCRKMSTKTVPAEFVMSTSISAAFNCFNFQFVNMFVCSTSFEEYFISVCSEEYVKTIQ